MPYFEITYRDSMTGESIRKWKGEAGDVIDACDKAHDDDYYLGQVLDVYERDEE
tara:strand:+ start:3626 stop:3787 length:162 start_codon:yes stop_codon:yes gene_type:complete